MGLWARGARQGSVPGAYGKRLGSRSPSPPPRRRVWASGNQRPSVPRDTGRPGHRPSPSGPSAHLRRERPQERDPRRSRAAASTTAAILCPRPPLLSSFPAPPPAPRPPASLRSGDRFRRSERNPRREARRGRAAGDGDGGLEPRPGRSRGHGTAAARLGRAGAPGPAAMAGYPRRPGVTPLSRARSLVIPDGERAGGRARERGAGRAARGGRPRLRTSVQVGAGRRPRRSRRGPGEAAAQSARTARGEVALVVIPAAAFYERRSCLPQLDCERPHGRDPDSHFFGIRPTFMCYVPSPVLASVGDTGERQASGTPGFGATCRYLCRGFNSPPEPPVSPERHCVPGAGNTRVESVLPLGAHSLVLGRHPPPQTDSSNTGWQVSK